MTRSPAPLYLLPTAIDLSSPTTCDTTILARTTAQALDYFLVETAKSARLSLKRMEHPRPLRELQIEEMPTRDDPIRVKQLLTPIIAGRPGAVISDAGCPGVADPGAQVVRAAHSCGLRVIPLVGASSILLSLMASGLDGQRFAFHGYLPVGEAERRKAVGELETESRRRHQTQIFIETPYRNQRMLDTLRSTCRGDTLLCVASGLTGAEEFIRTDTIARWKHQTPDLDRRPAVFLLLAQA